MVGVCEDGLPHWAFAFLSGIDPTYGYIKDGEWLNEEAYYTLSIGLPGTGSMAVFYSANGNPGVSYQHTEE